MEYSEYVTYFKFLSKYTYFTPKSFVATSYRHFKTNNEAIHKKFSEILKSEFKIDSIHTDYMQIVCLFESGILDNDQEYHKLPNIEIIFQVILATSTRPVFKLKSNVDFTTTQIEILSKLVNKMQSCFYSKEETQQTTTIQEYVKDNNDLISDLVPTSHSTGQSTVSTANNLLLNTSNQGQVNNNAITRDEFNLLTSLLNKLTETQQSLASSLVTNNQTHTTVNTNLKDSEGKITNLYHKLHRFENHVKNFKLLSEAKKTTSSLHFQHFPQPFLRDDNVFVDKWNTLVKDFQSKAMALNIDHSEITYKDTQTALLVLKENLSMYHQQELVTSTFNKLEINSKSYINNTVKESNNKVAIILRSKAVDQFMYKPPTKSSNTADRRPSNQVHSSSNRHPTNQRSNYQSTSHNNQQSSFNNEQSSYQPNYHSNNSKFRNNRYQSNRHHQGQAFH